MNNELYHWSMRRGEEAKQHKYTKRELVKTQRGKNIYRYYYGQTTKPNNTNKKFAATTSEALSKDKKALADSERKLKEDVGEAREDQKKAGFLFIPISKESLDKAKDWIADKIDSNKDDKVSDYNDVDKAEKNDRNDNSSSEISNHLDEFKSDQKNSKSTDKSVGNYVDSNGDRIQFNDSNELKEAYIKYGNDTEKAMAEEYGIKEGSYTPEEDMIEINEKFSYGPEYQNNCWSCSLSYDMRRRGFDVEAVESTNGGTSDYIAETYDVDPNTCWSEGGELWSYSWDEAYGDKDPYQVADEFIADAMKEGNDARGVMCVCWNPQIFGWCGHAMAWEVTDGKVVIRDCQDNTTYTGKDEIAALMSYTTGYQYMRTDDKQLKCKTGHDYRFDKN